MIQNLVIMFLILLRIVKVDSRFYQPAYPAVHGRRRTGQNNPGPALSLKCDDKLGISGLLWQRQRQAYRNEIRWDFPSLSF